MIFKGPGPLIIIYSACFLIKEESGAWSVNICNLIKNQCYSEQCFYEQAHVASCPYIAS